MAKYQISSRGSHAVLVMVVYQHHSQDLVIFAET